MHDSPYALVVLDLDQRRERPGRFGRVGILRPLDAREQLAADTFGTGAMVRPTWIKVARDPRAGYRPDRPWNDHKRARATNQAHADYRDRHARDARRARENYRTHLLHYPFVPSPWPGGAHEHEGRPAVVRASHFDRASTCYATTTREQRDTYRAARDRQERRAFPLDFDPED